ncbi:spore coat protein CotF [Peribacillus deserti]|uniref:Spore coat protein CotF n=1 Tax=Peribacillus deserti TaxID=673318 RepID=A0ABS2QHT2_9BACI|nr:spore coat protein [Peribacillus deserti]MBM7692731.1 spore coat protein CotF [Peribacillus deserti]
MINDYLEVENAEGLPEIADTGIAMEFLISVKTGVRNTAVALTESKTPEVRNTLRHQLEEGLELHKELSQFMISKGWLHPYNVEDQFKLDLKSADAALMIGEMKNLFPPDTSRRGMLADPHE